MKMLYKSLAQWRKGTQTIPTSGAKTEQPPPYLSDIVEAVQSLQLEKLERR